MVARASPSSSAIGVLRISISSLPQISIRTVSARACHSSVIWTRRIQDTWVQRKPDSLEAFVNRGGLVKLAFFGGLDTLQRVQDPRRAIGSRVQVAALVDLAGMKMGVIQVRANWKDYVDIHALVSYGIDVPTGLAVRAIDRSFDVAISIRTLQFYVDGTLDRVPVAIQLGLTRLAEKADLAKLPTLHPRRCFTPEGLER